MATRIFRLTNGVSFGVNYTVVAEDVTANTITFDFGVGYPLAVSVLVTTSVGVVVSTPDLIIDISENGKVTLTEGATPTFEFEAEQIISIVAQRARIG